MSSDYNSTKHASLNSLDSESSSHGDTMVKKQLKFQQKKKTVYFNVFCFFLL